MHIKELSLRWRLSLTGGGILLTTALIMAICSLMQIKERREYSHSKFHTLLTRESLATEYADIIRSDSAGVIAWMRTDDPGVRTTIDIQLKEERSRLQSIHEQISHQESTEEGRRLLTHVAAVRNTYNALREKELWFRSTRSPQEYRRFIAQEWLPVTDVFAQAADAVSAHQRHLIEPVWQEVQEAQAAKTTAEILLAALAFLTMAAGLIITVLCPRTG